MYTAPHPVTSSMNGVGTGMIDDPGTINPAALNGPGMPSCRRLDSVLPYPRIPWFSRRQHDLFLINPLISFLILPLLTFRPFIVSGLPPPINTAYNSAPRGLKRSRSPEGYNDTLGGQLDDGRSFISQNVIAIRIRSCRAVRVSGRSANSR